MFQNQTEVTGNRILHTATVEWWMSELKSDSKLGSTLGAVGAHKNIRLAYGRYSLTPPTHCIPQKTMSTQQLQNDGFIRPLLSELVEHTTGAALRNIFFCNTHIYSTCNIQKSLLQQYKIYIVILF